MKVFILTLIVSIVWLPLSYADLNATQNGATVSGPTSGQLTQQNTEQSTNDLNKAGQQQSNMLGMMAIAAGAAMVAAGMACSCPGPNGGLIAAGAALIASGMMALSAAAQMGKNAGIANGYNNNLGNSSGLSQASADNGIKIDPGMLHEGKAGEIFDNMEKQTGMSRDDLIKGLNSGVSLSKMMADAKKGTNAAAIDKAIAAADGNMNRADMLDKLGLKESDLDTSYATTGTASGKKTADNTPSFDPFAKPTDPNNSTGLGTKAVKVSDDVQNALDQNGITNRSIFEMVHTQYKKKAPQMFGIMQDKTRMPASTENPFGNLETGDIKL